MTSTVEPESAIRCPAAVPENPANTCEWTMPSRAAASIATGSSGTIGMWNVIRSPAFSPSSFSTAANSLTRTYSSR